MSQRENVLRQLELERMKKNLKGKSAFSLYLDEDFNTKAYLTVTASVRRAISELRSQGYMIVNLNANSKPGTEALYRLE